MQNNRRSFMKNVGYVTAGTFCSTALILFQGCVSYRSLEFTKSADVIKVSKYLLQDIKDGVIHYQRLPAPIYLKEHTRDDYTAVLLECTHKQCQVAPTDKILICPCHGSEFSDKGKVLTGPAELDLHHFKVTYDDNQIYISLRSKV